MQFHLTAVSILALVSHVSAFDQKLNDAIRGLYQDPSGGGKIQLSDNGRALQSVNANGDILDQVAITGTEESILRSELSVAYAKAKLDGRLGQSAAKAQDGLEKREGCPPLHIPCKKRSDCTSHHCDACLTSNPVGFCYGYSK